MVKESITPQLREIADKLIAGEGNAGITLNALLTSRRRAVAEAFAELSDAQRSAIQPFLTVERSASDFDAGGVAVVESGIEDGVGEGETTLVGSLS